MAKRISFLLFLMLTGAGALIDSAASKPQERAPAPVSNKCVSCHSQLTGTSKISARYLEWHSSAHKAKAVGCEKCHGGDPTSSDLKKAHSGVLPPQDLRSRLHNNNVPETCGVCHKAVVSSFVESTHYVRLKDTGLGPSCITCHGHMASKIATYPSEGAAFCSFCHNTINGIQARRPEIPEKAQATLESLGRVNSIVVWINSLLSECQGKKIAVDEEKEDLRLLTITWREAKTGWHAFNLDGPHIKADKAFEEGVRIKNQLVKKLGHD